MLKHLVNIFCLMSCYYSNCATVLLWITQPRVDSPQEFLHFKKFKNRFNIFFYINFFAKSFEVRPRLAFLLLFMQNPKHSHRTFSFLGWLINPFMSSSCSAYFQVICLSHKILHAWHKRHINVHTHAFWRLLRWKKNFFFFLVRQQVQSVRRIWMEIYLILIKCRFRFCEFY